MNDVPTMVERLADYALLIVYAPIIGFFAWRRYRVNRARGTGHHRTSVGIGMSSFGWIFLAALDLGWCSPLPYAPVRWLGVAAGVFLLRSALRGRRDD